MSSEISYVSKNMDRVHYQLAFYKFSEESSTSQTFSRIPSPAPAPEDKIELMSWKICFLKPFKIKMNKVCHIGTSRKQGCSWNKVFLYFFQPRRTQHTTESMQHVCLCMRLCVCVYSLRVYITQKSSKTFFKFPPFFCTCLFTKETPCLNGYSIHTHTLSLNTRHLFYVSLPDFQRGMRRRRKGRVCFSDHASFVVRMIKDTGRNREVQLSINHLG